MATVYCHDTEANVAFLALDLGFETSAILAWLRCECQSVANPTNPLNIRSTAYGAIGRNSEGFAVYPNVETGLRAVRRLLEANASSYGYGAVLAQRSSGDAYSQARAVELSDWAAGHYGATATTDGCIASQIEVRRMRLDDAPGSYGQVTIKVRTKAYRLDGTPGAEFLPGVVRNVTGDAKVRSDSPITGIPPTDDADNPTELWIISSSGELLVIPKKDCSPLVPAASFCKPLVDEATQPLKSEVVRLSEDKKALSTQLDTVRSERDAATAEANKWDARAVEALSWGRSVQSRAGQALALREPEWGSEVPET